MGTDDLDGLRIRPWPRPLVLLLADLHHRQPTVAAVGVKNAGPPRYARLVAIDLVASGFARDRKAREIAAPIFVEHHGERRRSHHLDASAAPGLAAGAVAGKHIFGVPALAAAGFHRANLADHAVLDLLEADEFGREMHLHQVRMRNDLIDLLLYRILRDQGFPSRGLAEIGLGTRAADLAAGDAFDLHKHVGGILQTTIADRLLDAPLAEDFHGADPAAARLWMVGRGRALLDNDGVDAEAIEQQPHREPHRPAADDHNGCAAQRVGRRAHERFLPRCFVWAAGCALFDISQEYV